MKLKGSIHEDHFDLDYQEPLSPKDLAYVQLYMQEEIRLSKLKLEEISEEARKFRIELGIEIKASNDLLLIKWKEETDEIKRKVGCEKSNNYNKRMRRLKALTKQGNNS